MTVQSDTIQEDVSFGFDDDDADAIGANAFLANLTGEEPRKRPSTDEGETGAPDTDGTETPAATDETEQGTEVSTDPDDAEVEIKVGEETKKATLKELKRLYGQEASLTVKSQQVAEARKVADAQRERADLVLKTMMEKAEEKFKPYKELDWFVLSQRMATDDFQALRADYEAAQKDLVFLQTEVDGRLNETRNAALQARNAAAVETIKLLEDPEKGIPGFGQKLYNDMIGYALKQGVTEAPNMVHPGALKIIHKAMLYDQEQAAKKEAESKVNKAVNQAKRVLNPKTTSQPTNTVTASRRDAMRTLKQSGSVDDAAAAFLSTFRE